MPALEVAASIDVVFTPHSGSGPLDPELEWVHDLISCPAIFRRHAISTIMLLPGIIK